MGIKNSVFVDNSTPQCDAEFLNSVRSEINNIITNTGQTPSTANLGQLEIATSIYAAGGNYYTDSGAADAYVLSVVGSKLAPDVYFEGMKIRFIVTNTNTGASTVNVDSLGVKSIVARDGSSALSAGDLVANQAVSCFYDGTNFVIDGGVAYAAAVIPVGTMLDYAGTTAPSGYLLCYGQAVSRATYADLFSTISTSFGVGDGSTTFNLPDCRGRTKVGLDNLGSVSADRITSANADSLNNTGGGAESVTPTGSITISAVTLSEANLPSSVTIDQSGCGAVNDGVSGTTYLAGVSAGALARSVTISLGSGSSFTPTGTTTITSTSVTQPWIALGVIIKT